MNIKLSVSLFDCFDLDMAGGDLMCNGTAVIYVT